MTVLVPTMGALHKGHQALIKRARELDKEVVVSIFVNPLQFTDAADLEKYPRTPETDIQIATLAGATEVWFPNYDEIYPSEPTQISAGAVGELYEGAARPGHFAGVLTVVNRLFEIVKPSAAVFGEKDFQQLWLIKNYFKKLEIVAVPTVREFDGLALSSRNIRLTQADRVAALIISKALKDPTRMHEILATEPAFKLDYAEIIDEKTFQKAGATTQNKRAIIAGWVNGVRLLDNAVVETNS
jgi:pantoate--beta-alanine ligase